MTAALGWCWSTTRPPQGVTLHPSGAVAIASGTASTARERMKLQAAIVASGADVLPLAPASQVSLTQAAALSLDGVAQALRAISGQVQMTLLATPQDHPKPAGIATGRDWLRARQGLRDDRDAWCNRLHAFAQNVSPKTTQPTWRNSRLHCAIMIRRTDVDALKDRLHATSHALPKARLVVTGPWPPYSFTQPLAERRAA